MRTVFVTSIGLLLILSELAVLLDFAFKSIGFFIAVVAQVLVVLLGSSYGWIRYKFFRKKLKWESFRDIYLCPLWLGLFVNSAIPVVRSLGNMLLAR